MKILIFGASGATGRHLVKQALDQQHYVTAFVRDPAKLTIEHNNLKLVQGNVINYQEVENAINGHDAVLSALGANSPFRYDQVVVDGMENIIKAMQAAKVERLIYLSTAGVKASRRDAGFAIRFIAPKLLRTEIAGHEAREKMIKQSHLKWTIIHAPALTNGEQKKEYQYGENLKATSFLVALSRADVADFMLKQLTDNSYICKTARLMPRQKSTIY